MAELSKTAEKLIDRVLAEREEVSASPAFHNTIRSVYRFLRRHNPASIRTPAGRALVQDYVNAHPSYLRQAGATLAAHFSEQLALHATATATATVGEPAHYDPVTRPEHYANQTDPAYEPIKVIEAWELGFNAGNVVKYVARHAKKGTPIVDLKKARQYLDFEIDRLERQQKSAS